MTFINHRYWPFISGAILLVAPLVDRLRRPLEINTDASIYLQFALLMLKGQIPYVDFGDLNPPLIMYMSVLPQLMAQTLAWPPILCFSLLVFLATALCTLLSWYFIIKNKALDAAIQNCLIPAVPLISLVMLFQYGQRDHLGVYFVLPFFFMRLAQISGARPAQADQEAGTSGATTFSPWLKIFVGLLAGFGPCLKPENLVPLILLEIYACLQKGEKPKLDLKAALPAYLAMLSIGLTYALHFFLLPRAMFDRYFHFIVPLVQRGYHCYDCSLTEVLVYPFIAAPLLIVLTIAGAIYLRRNALAALFFAWMAAGYGICFFYHTFMPHHLIVMEAGAVFLGAVLIAAMTARARWVAPLAAVATVTYAGFACFGQTLPSPMRAEGVRQLATIISTQSRPGEYVAMLGTNISPPYPLLLQQDRLQGLRYPYLFTLSISQYIRSHHGDNSGFEHLEDETYRTIDEDIKGHRPRLVMVFAEKNSQGCDPDFSLIDWLRARGLFADALRDYQQIGEAGFYKVYERR